MNQNPGPLIWGIATSILDPLLSGKPFYTDGEADAILAALEQKGEWKHRYTVEEDPTFRQVIPYVLTSSTNIGPPKYLLMTRMTKQGEKRLHGKEYIGVGGHTEQEDGKPGEAPALKAAAWREITEETGFTVGDLKFIGIICLSDPSLGMVNQVHIGVAFHLRTPEEKFGGDEGDQHNHRWASLNDLNNAYPNMELWAQVVCKDYLGISG